MAPLKTAWLAPLAVALPRVTVPEPLLATVIGRAIVMPPDVALINKLALLVEVPVSVSVTVPLVLSALLF